MILSGTSSAGNLFLHVQEEELPGTGAKEFGKIAIWLCQPQRSWGGADGLVVYRPDQDGARFFIFNLDGTQAEISGNGMAGLSALLFRDSPEKIRLHLKALPGSRTVRLLRRSDPEFLMQVEIGVPDFSNRCFFPFLESGRSAYEVCGTPFYPVSVGNPHVVVIDSTLPSETEMMRIGHTLSDHDLFPKRTNVEFAALEDRRHCRAFFYERGVGPTSSSSTGSSAIFAILRELDRTGENLTVHCPGGDLVLSGKRGIYIRNRSRIEFQEEVALPDEFSED